MSSERPVLSTLSLVALFSLFTTGAYSQLSVEQSDLRITVSQSGSAVLTYNIKSPPAPVGVDSIFERSGFLHPVNTPSGACVTAAFPADHEHQQGIFSAWTETEYGGKEVDFWNLADRTGRVSHHRVLSVIPSDGQVEINVELFHQVLSDPIVNVLKDHWKIKVYNTKSDFYCFDIESQQAPLTDKPLHLKKYIYGGQAFRGPVAWLEPNDSYAKANSSLAAKGAVMLTSERKNRLEGNHTPTNWVAISGVPVSDAGELIYDAKEASTLIVLSHRENFRSPQSVRLHPTKPYFCFSPCVDAPFTIEKPNNYVSKYRYLLTSNAIDPEWIDAQWDAWHSAQK